MASASACCAASATASLRSGSSPFRERPGSRKKSRGGRAPPSSRSAFAGRLRVDGERVHGTGEFARKRRIYHAVTFDPALPFEGGRYDIHPEVRLPGGPVAGMALMQV